MQKKTKVLALVLAGLMTAGTFAGCAPKDNTTPLVVGYAPFSSKFSPFFAESAYDQDAQAMTQIGLLSSDRTGAIIYKGIEGETINYNGTDYTYYGASDLIVTPNEDGTVYYDFTLRDGMKFSDGEEITIDDVIFSMYVYADPTYDGSTTFFALPIEGMEAYRAGMASKWTLILADGPDAAASEYYTAEEAAAFWTAFNEAGIEFAQEIVDYCIANGYGTDVATAAPAWGYELGEGATVEDFWNKIVENFGYDVSDTGINYESAGTSITSLITAKLDSSLIAGVQTGESAETITGIQKTGENSLRVVLTEVDATAIYQLGVTIAPLHYYGSEELYNYDNNQFGFPKGDLSSVRAKTTQPMGAGPYKFLKFENGVIYFEANENYFLGAPKTKFVNFMETQEADKLNGVTTGTIDITDPSFDTNTVTAIKSANGGDLTGSVVTVNTVDNLGYGYIGISANRMNVAGDVDSDASKNLRKAFATILSVYRDVSVDSYYGERASVINYPISNTSWAAPQTTDAGYKVAFSVDVNGNDIYTSDMDADAKYAAAKAAALGYFEAAGYTVEDGKVTAAPEGASLTYELWIPADGAGDHPSFMICTLADEAFAEIGIDLVVKDLANSADLWTALEAEGVDMWCAAWNATVDPDMYQIYYADVANNGASAGGSNYMYDIADVELDQLIMDARKSMDQAFRKQMYKTCLDIIVDWAVEIPVYQRQNAIIFSTERVNMDTMTPDITTFYGWMSEIQNIELN